MEVLDDGHIYLLGNLEGQGHQLLQFVKRSGGAIKYGTEWSGCTTQEVIRVLIERTLYLDSVLPCDESKDAVWFLRSALYAYELRAWRRKQEKLNRKQPEHEKQDGDRDRPPFDLESIEVYPTGLDGHIYIE